MRGETWITTREALNMLQLSRNKLMKLCDENVIRYTKVIGSVYYSLESIEMMFDHLANKAYFDPKNILEKRMAEEDRLAAVNNPHRVTQRANLARTLQKRAVIALARLAGVLNQIEELTPEELYYFTKKVNRERIAEVTQARIPMANSKAIKVIHEIENELDATRLPTGITSESEKLQFKAVYGLKVPGVLTIEQEQTNAKR